MSPLRPSTLTKRVLVGEDQGKLCQQAITCVHKRRLDCGGEMRDVVYTAMGCESLWRLVVSVTSFWRRRRQFGRKDIVCTNLGEYIPMLKIWSSPRLLNLLKSSPRRFAIPHSSYRRKKASAYLIDAGPKTATRKTCIVPEKLELYRLLI